MYFLLVSISLLYSFLVFLLIPPLVFWNFRTLQSKVSGPFFSITDLEMDIQTVKNAYGKPEGVENEN